MKIYDKCEEDHEKNYSTGEFKTLFNISLYNLADKLIKSFDIHFISELREL